LIPSILLVNSPEVYGPSFQALLRSLFTDPLFSPPLLLCRISFPFSLGVSWLSEKKVLLNVSRPSSPTSSTRFDYTGKRRFASSFFFYCKTFLNAFIPTSLSSSPRAVPVLCSSPAGSLRGHLRHFTTVYRLGPPSRLTDALPVPSRALVSLRMR